MGQLWKLQRSEVEEWVRAGGADLTQAQFDAFKADLAAARTDANEADVIAALLTARSHARAGFAQANLASRAGQVALQATLDALAPQLKSAGQLLEARHKQWLKLLDTAEKQLRARQSKALRWQSRP